MDKKTKTSRRQCFSAIARWSIAGGIAAMSGKLLSGEGTKEVSCVDPKGRIGCRKCSLLPGCGLPRGLSVKQFLKRENA